MVDYLKLFAFWNYLVHLFIFEMCIQLMISPSIASYTATYGADGITDRVVFVCF